VISSAALKPGEVRAVFVSKDGRGVTIRPLRRSDLDALVRFANRISKEKAVNRELGIVSLDGRITRANEREFLNHILSAARSREAVSLAAFVDGDVVGHADIWRRKPKDVRHTGVFGIVVCDGYRGVGIGKRLMAEVLRESRLIGVWLVELTVFATNEGARRLYEKMGFEKVGVIPEKIVRGERHFDEVLMYADLRKR
jgi:ribosomal protein S18 acetylase RimI-like enzyme